MNKNLATILDPEGEGVQTINATIKELLSKEPNGPVTHVRYEDFWDNFRSHIVSVDRVFYERGAPSNLKNRDRS